MLLLPFQGLRLLCEMLKIEQWTRCVLSQTSSSIIIFIIIFFRFDFRFHFSFGQMYMNGNVDAPNNRHVCTECAHVERKLSNITFWLFFLLRPTRRERVWHIKTTGRDTINPIIQRTPIHGTSFAPKVSRLGYIPALQAKGSSVGDEKWLFHSKNNKEKGRWDRFANGNPSPECSPV